MKVSARSDATFAAMSLIFASSIGFAGCGVVCVHFSTGSAGWRPRPLCPLPWLLASRRGRGVSFFFERHGRAAARDFHLRAGELAEVEDVLQPIVRRALLQVVGQRLVDREDDRTRRVFRVNTFAGGLAAAGRHAGGRG